MTFVLVAAFGLGVILIQSAVENVSISQTIRDIMSGQLGIKKSSSPASGAGGSAGTFSQPVNPTPPTTQPL